MKNKINFITGETYTLAELFSGNRRIIIPDLQRDYCWGNKEHTKEKKELVSGFLRTLIAQYESNDSVEPLNLGIIYGYESPEDNIQLCDGQQRITTLFLLLGMLNKKTSINRFRNLLISDYKYFQDDKEPYLNYAIRDSSLYFLSDLVCHFFIKEHNDSTFIDKCDEIKDGRWYFREYDSDPSICSILKAIKIIEKLLEDKDSNWCEKFGLFLSSKLTFIYYDMENRKNGEETFVVINTTGEPLSNTQNLKPLIIIEEINKNYERWDELKKKNTLSEDWENIETWFWEKRRNSNDTADAGFNEFIRWITILNSPKENIKRILSTGKYNFPKDAISFKEIYSYWEIIKFLFENWEGRAFLDSNYLSPEINTDNEGTKTIGQIDCFQLLPLIEYCKIWGIPQKNDRNLLRLYQYLHNLARIDNVKKAVNDLVFDAINIAKSCEDIIKLIDENLQWNISNMLLTKEERLKLEILKSNPSMREDIENYFWQAQSCRDKPCHYIWSGQILPLIEWSIENNRFDLEKFKTYLNVFDNVFKENGDSRIDNVRRALLTRNLKEYPKIFKGFSNYSFAWEWSDWSVLIEENKEAFKQFFDNLLRGISLEKMISDFSTTEKWSEFVHKKYLMDYCEQKNIRWDTESGWLLIKRQRVTSYISVYNHHLEKYLSKNLKCNNWNIWIWDGNRVVVENKISDFVFDIYNKNKTWIIQFFKREQTGDSLEKFIDTTWIPNGNRFEKTISFASVNQYDFPEVKNLLVNVINNISQSILN